MAKRKASKKPMEVNTAECRKAINALYVAFLWHQSPQGYKAWANVIDALEEIIANAKGE